MDHTFFLANFCTTSIASSMFASFMPKRESYRGFSDSSSDKQQPGTTSSSSQAPSANSSSTVTTISSHPHGGTSLEKGAASTNNGIKGAGTQQPADKVNSTGGGYYGGNDLTAGSGGGGSGLYNGGDLVGRAGTGASQVTPAVSGVTSASGQTSGQQQLGPGQGQDGDLPKAPGNVFGGHELVAAISQITRRPEETSPTKPGASSAGAGKKDPWSKDDSDLLAEDGSSGGQTTGGVKRGGQQANNAGGGGGTAGFIGHNGYGGAGGGGGPNTQASPGMAADSAAQGQQQQHHDASTESVTSESDDGRPAAVAAAAAAAAAASGNATAAATAAAVAAYNSMDFENKPLSFARIASLGLEKAGGAAPGSRMGGGAAGSAVGSLGGAGTGAGQGGAQNPLVGGIGGGGGSKVGPQPLTANMTPLPPPINMGGVMDRSGAGGPVGLVGVTGLGGGPGGVGVSSSGGGPPGGMGSAPSSSSAAASASGAMPLIPLPPSSNPRYFFDIAMEGKRLGRVIIEVQPAVAPKMSQNFGMLVTGERGFGYKGCQFFQAWKNESVICGDWEHNSGRGGRAAVDGGPLFTPDETRLPCIRGAVGMRRMSKKHSSLNQVREIIFPWVYFRFCMYMVSLVLRWHPSSASYWPT